MPNPNESPQHEEGIAVFTFGTPDPGIEVPLYGEIWLTIDCKWWSPEDDDFVSVETMAQLLPWLVKVNL